MKKICILLIIGMFIVNMLPGIVGENEALEFTLKEKKYNENRKIIPIYTEHGFKNLPNSKGKPGAYVIITNPEDDYFQYHLHMAPPLLLIACLQGL